MRGRAGLAAGTAATILANAPSDDATINEALNDNSKSVVGQAVAASVDALKHLADDARAYARGFEITRQSSVHPGRHGIGSDAVAAPERAAGMGLPATMSVGADTSALDAAFGKINTIHDAAAAPARMHIDVDAGQIEDAYEKVLQLHRAIDGLKNTMSGIGGMTPSLDSTIRGNFSFGRGEW